MLQTHESQLAAVAIASAVFGYWLATGGTRPSLLGSTDDYEMPTTRGPKPAQSGSTPLTSIPEEPTNNKKKNKSKLAQQTTQEDTAKPETDGEVDTGSESEDELAAVSEAALDQVKAGKWEECKLVLVVNQELGMTKGKIAAQCGHATLACYKTLLQQNPKLLKHWEQTGQAKVAVKCTSTAELLKLQSEARALNLCARSIQDAGRTQIAAGSRTVLGIGPGPIKLVNQVTGHLKLL